MFRTLTLKSALLVVVLAAGPAGASGDQPAGPVGAVRVGDIAPDFTLQTFDGEVITLSKRTGQTPILLLFWSFFCYPCQKEVPKVDAIAKELGPERLLTIGISLDGPQYDARVRPFVEEHGITFPNGYDRETEEYYEVAERYGVMGTPTSFLLDLQGRVRFIHLGVMDPDVLKTLVKSACDKAFCPDIRRLAAPPAR